MNSLEQSESANRRSPESDGSATRWAAVGDTIQTTMSNGSVMTHTINNPMDCAFANELISSGRWQVSPNTEVSHTAG